MLAAVLAAIVPLSARAATGGWPTYHLDGSRTADDSGEPAMTVHAPTGDWTFSVTDTKNTNVFASPIVFGGKVFVATENNSIYALDETTGTPVWSDVDIAQAIPGSGTYIGCSATQFGATNGITGTPVIDPATGTLYAVLGEPVASNGHNSTYYLYAVDAATGSQLWNQALSFPDLDPKYQNQRGALGVAGGYVYVTFGGRDGDCGAYHPWVVGVPVAGATHTPISYQPQTPATMNEAGIWAPSGMAIDGSGNVYVETGNGAQGPTGGSCPASSWDFGDGVIKLSPTLSQLSVWAPADWCDLNAADADLGSVAPMILPSGDVFASGKSGDAWLLNSASLGGVNGSPRFSAHLPGCQTSDAVFGGFAFDGQRIFVPCDNAGLVALNYSSTTHSFTTAWQSSSTAGYAASPGAPIVAGGLVWVEDQSGGAVHAFDPATGVQRFGFSIGGAHRFTTLAADGGRIFAMLSGGIQAFNMSNFTVAYTAYLPWYDRISDPGFASDDIHVVNPDPTNAVLVSVTIPGRPGCVVSGDTIAPKSSKFYSCATGYGGPVVIQASATVLASARVRYYQSFNEVAAIPATAATTTLYFPWYDHASDGGFTNDNVHVVNPSASTVSATVAIPGCAPRTQPVAPGSYQIFSCGSGFGGPVTIQATGPVVATQRVQYFSSFNEVAAQAAPADAPATLWLDWYDNTSSPGFLADNVHVVNTGASTETVSASVPGCAGVASQSVAPGGYAIFAFPNCIGGPIKVAAGGGFIASVRVKYYRSFNEVAASASAQTSSWFAWYDRASDPGFQVDNVHVINPGSSTVTATVKLPVCGAISRSIPAQGYSIFNCGSVGGPVSVSSTGPVLAFQRVEYYQSFNEVRSQP